MSQHFKQLDDPNEAHRLAVQLAQLGPPPNTQQLQQAMLQVQGGPGPAGAQPIPASPPNPQQPQSIPAATGQGKLQSLASTQGVNPILAQLMQGAQ